MHPFWEIAIKPLLDAAKADTVMEIGVEHGRTTKLLLDRARSRGRGTVHAIDPVPRIDVSAWGLEYGSSLQLHRGRSLQVLPQIGPVDAALVDGDHNYYTVVNELRAIAATSGQAGAPLPVLVCHDVGWPYGRRDLYYDPNSIPFEHRHTAVRGGLLPGRNLPGAPGINGNLWNARNEGGPKNGVLTAIEDFRDEFDQPTHLVVLPGFHGLAVIASEERVAASEPLARELERLRSAPVMARLAESLELTRIQAGIIGEPGGARTAGPSGPPVRKPSNDPHPADRDHGLLD